MTEVAALKALLAKVEAGELSLSAEENDYAEAWAALGGGREIFWPAQLAYGGSLDAAKALHDALLPGWFWYRQGFVMYVTEDHTGWGTKPHFRARDDKDPARAWLIAIIKALIAEAAE